MPSDEISDFFETLFARKDAGTDDGWLLIWAKGNERDTKISHWAKNVPEAIGIARAEKDNIDRPDLYFGCATSSQRRGANQRTTKKNARALFFVWADIDVAGAGHKTKSYPDTESEAIALARSIGIEPSMIVASGGGIHAYWLLDKPLLIPEGENEQRSRAMALMEGFQAALRARAAKHKWSLDSTHDLARVLRVPGTINHKYANHVYILERDETRVYSYDELAAIAGETLLESTAKTTKVVAPKPQKQVRESSLSMNLDAEPPLDKLEVLQEYHPKFKQTYDRKRNDLESQSEYDLALASFAVISGWSDQEIADLLVHHRKKHGEDVAKALREDYIRRTIRRARSNVQFDEAQERISENIDLIKEGEQTIDEAREDLLRDLSQALDVQIDAIVKYLGDPPLYKLRTPTGEVTIGNVKNILKQDEFRACLADTSAIVIKRFKGPRWDDIAQAILKACTVEDLGLGDQILSWLEGYLEEVDVLGKDERDAAMETRQPFNYRAKVAIFVDEFRKWLALRMHVKFSDPRRLAAELRSNGSEMIRVRYGKTTRSVCLLPFSAKRFADPLNSENDKVPF